MILRDNLSRVPFAAATEEGTTITPRGLPPYGESEPNAGGDYYGY